MNHDEEALVYLDRAKGDILDAPASYNAVISLLASIAHSLCALNGRIDQEMIDYCPRCKPVHNEKPAEAAEVIHLIDPETEYSTMCGLEYTEDTPPEFKSVRSSKSATCPTCIHNAALVYRPNEGVKE